VIPGAYLRSGDDPDAAAVTAKLRAVDERRDELAAAWAAGEISRKEWSTARRSLDDQTAKLTRQLSRKEHGRALAAGLVRSVALTWP
jgi:hypothetical protein